MALSVRRIYGVFVDIGGVDGMVTYRRASWSRIKIYEVVSVGDPPECVCHLF